MKGRRTNEDLIIDSVITVLLCVVAFVTIYPFYYTLIISLNEGKDAMLGGIYVWPRAFTLDNYHFFLSDPKWTKAFVVTILRTVVGTTLTILFTCLVAYGLSKGDLIGRRIYFITLIVSMYFSGGLIAIYVVLRSLGLLNTFGVYVIPTMLDLFFVLVGVAFFREIASEIGDSARIDGASELAIFIRIVMPISLPLVAVMCLFVGSGQWNSWVDSAYFVQNDNLRTLAFRMMQVINQAMVPVGRESAERASMMNVTPYSVQTTAMIISVAPILCLYPFLQKYFVQGMMLGSVKG